MKRNFILLFFILIAFSAFSQGELSPSNWKMTQAKLLFEDNKPAEALVIYLELYADYSQDAFLNYRIGECYLKTKELETSLEYLNKALSKSKDESQIKEIIYLQACAQHKLNKFDEALTNYKKVCAGTDVVDSLQIAKLISQVEVAKIEFEHPKNYFIYSAGDSINTSFDEIYPVFSRNKNLLYFTSDRQIKDTQEKSSKTHSYPYSCFEANVGEKGIPTGVTVIDEAFAAGKNFILNTVDAGDAVYYLYKTSNEIKDGGDLYIDTKDTDEDFTDSEKLPGFLNTIIYKASASYDFIRQELFFVSNIKSKSTQVSDIFMSSMFKGKFPEPEIIKALSTDSDEPFVYIHPGGDFAVFASNSEKSMGGYDLFISFNESGKWTDPVNMGYPINSTFDETQFSLSSDAKYAYISSDRAGGMGGFDIYIIEASPYFAEKMGKTPSLVVVSGQVINEDGTGVATTIKISDLNYSKVSIDAKTDADGYYTFVINAGSKYMLQIKEKIYTVYTEELDYVNSNEVYIEKDIELIAKP